MIAETACTDGAAAVADRRSQTLLHRDRRNLVNVELQVIARHHHLGALWQLNPIRHVRSKEVELRTAFREERGGGVTTAFSFDQSIGFCFELRVWGHRTWLAENQTTPKTITAHTTRQCADVSPALRLSMGVRR